MLHDEKDDYCFCVLAQQLVSFHKKRKTNAQSHKFQHKQYIVYLEIKSLVVFEFSRWHLLRWNAVLIIDVGVAQISSAAEEADTNLNSQK